MSRGQYLKLLEQEIQAINKAIDQKIINGENYVREARDHKLLLKKVRYHTQRNFFNRLFPSVIHYF